MVCCLKGVKEVDIKRLEPAAHLRWKKNDVNVPGPASFKEIDLRVRFRTVEDEEAPFTAATGNIACKGVKHVFKPFYHHIVVDPA